jgi:hypothetical protein
MGTESRIRGAIWSHFFKKFPRALSLEVKNLNLISDNYGSATLLLEEGSRRCSLVLEWESLNGEVKVISCGPRVLQEA